MKLCRILSILSICFLVTACVSAQGNKEISNPEKISAIKKGKSTKKEIKALLGQPTTVEFSENDREVWHYSYAHSKVRASSFIPYAGIFVGGVDTKTNSLVVKFNKQGIVTAYAAGGSVGGGGGLQDMER